MNDPVSQMNTARQMRDWGNSVEQWRQDVANQERELMAKLFPPSPVNTARTDSADTPATSGKTKKESGG